jgi:hypothetical protein
MEGTNGITQTSLLDLLNSFGLICIAPDIQWCSAPWGYQRRKEQAVSTNLSLTLRNTHPGRDLLAFLNL